MVMPLTEIKHTEVFTDSVSSVLDCGVCGTGGMSTQRCLQAVGHCGSQVGVASLV